MIPIEQLVQAGLMSGFSGVSGYSGYSGVSGYSGYSGSGVSGYSGYSGVSGYSGFSGVSGYSGWSGISGYSGYSGISGYSGFSGISGYSGWSGVSGYSGYSGTAGPATAINATDDSSTSSAIYPVMVGAAGSNQTPKVTTTKFTFTPSTGALSITGTGSFSGLLTASASVAVGGATYSQVYGTNSANRLILDSELSGAGAEINLYGSTHATKPKYTEIYTDNFKVLSISSSTLFTIGSTGSTSITGAGAELAVSGQISATRSAQNTAISAQTGSGVYSGYFSFGRGGTEDGFIGSASTNFAVTGASAADVVIVAQGGGRAIRFATDTSTVIGTISSTGLSVTGTGSFSAAVSGRGISNFSRANASAGTANSVYDDLVVGSTSTANTGMTLFATGQTGIAFGDAGSSIAGQVRYQHSTDVLELISTSGVDIYGNGAGGGVQAAIRSTGLSVTGTGSFSGAISGTGPDNNITLSQNGNTQWRVVNSNAGTAALAAFVLQNGTASAGTYLLGTGYTTNGVLIANRAFLYNNNAAGIAIVADNASGTINFAAGGLTSVGSWSSTGLSVTGTGSFNKGSSGDVLSIRGGGNTFYGYAGTSEFYLTYSASASGAAIGVTSTDAVMLGPDQSKSAKVNNVGLSVTGTGSFTGNVSLANNTTLRALNTDGVTYHNLIGLTQGAPTNQIGIGDGTRTIYMLGNTSVTGAGTFTANSAAMNIAPAAGTNAVWYYASNTGGTLYSGVSTSTGGGILIGDSAYAGVIGTGGATSLQFGTNNTVRMTINSSGAVSMTSTLSVNNATIGNTSAMVKIRGNGSGYGLGVESDNNTVMIHDLFADQSAGVRYPGYKMRDSTGSTAYWEVSAINAVVASYSLAVQAHAALAGGQAKATVGAFNAGSAAGVSAEMFTYAQAGTQKISHFWANSLTRYQIQTLASGATISLAPDTGGTDVLVVKSTGVDVTGTISASAASGAFTGLQVGTGGGTNTGFIIGNYSSGGGGMWSTAVTPSLSNYALAASNANTSINAPTSGGTLNLNINNSTVAQIVSTGLSVTGTISATSTGQVTSLGVGTAPSGTTGEIRATNNITAYYSDDNLKTKLGNIENALAKVLSLNGFYYEANEVAQSLGYEKVREVGISAQEMQKVLPEIVVPAPIDDKYLTIRYERSIPLLIEAIKELAQLFYQSKS